MANRLGTLMDWNAAGVSIMVELATSGDLVLGGQTTTFDLVSGGPNGAPYGWTPYTQGASYPITSYDFTTQSGIASISNQLTTMPNYAGIRSPVIPLVNGAKYNLQCQCRLIAGKGATSRYPSLQLRNRSTGAWTWYVGPSAANAQSSWESINTTGTSGVSTATYDAICVDLLGNTSPTLDQHLWGVQYQSVSITQVDAMVPEPTWRDITCDVRSINIRHGREKFTNRYEVGHFDIELINRDGEYRFMNPHPFGLRPGRQVRITATYKGVSYPLAFGLIDSIGQSYALDGTVLATLQLVDASSVMSNTTTTAGVYSAPSSTVRVGELIRKAGYTKQIIDASGGFTMQPIAASGRSLREEAGVTGDSEGGSFFADRSGNLVYMGRQWVSTDPKLTTVQADFVAQQHDGYGPMMNPDGVPTVDNSPLVCVNEIATDWSMDRVINYVTLANAGGTAQTFTNDESIKAHGVQTYQRLDFVALSDTNLPVRADDFMNGFADPILRVNSVAFNPGVQKNPDIAWPFVLSVFLNWLIRVWYSQPEYGWGFIVVTHVQSIQHTITPDGWACEFSVDQPLAYTEVEWADRWTGWDQGNWDEDIWDGASNPDPSLWSSGDTWSDPLTVWSD